MKTQMVQDVTQAYGEVASLCGLESARAKPWAAANDALLLQKILSRTDKETDSILDFGCCGWPWITNYLQREGYDVVGVDVYKPHWFDHDIARELDLSLVGYDGNRLPFTDGSFDIVLAFGVLEHVGIWKSDDEKYRTRTPEVTAHRRRVLGELRRTIAADGSLCITKFPNSYGRDKLVAKLFGMDPGHYDSERARPSYLRELISEQFEIQTVFADGLLPHRLPFGAPTSTLPWLYANLDSTLSEIPVLNLIAQNYGVIATPNRRRTDTR